MAATDQASEAQTERVEESGDVIIRMSGIERRFGRIHALDGVNISLREGEILGLTGDNGSGKSTLIKILVGVHEPTAGNVYVRGERIRFSNPRAARRHGIATVYQDLALVDEQSVAANIFLGRAPVRKVGGFVPVVDWKRMNRESSRILEERLNLDINPKSRVEFLSGGERQAIAISRALVSDPDVVVLDEPTSALSADSAARVRDLIDGLREEGLSIIMISHNMEEVHELADRISVLDNGNLVGTVNTDEVTRDDIVRMIVDGKLVDGVKEDSDFD